MGKGKPAAKPKGRPSSYTKEIADQICEQLALGRSLRSICNELAMPDQTTVFRWLRDREDFRLQYGRAREEQADTHFDEIVDIADTDEDAQRARLRVDARKWVAGKLAPKKYGEKIQTEVSGVIEVDESPSDARRKAALALLLARQG